MVSTKKKSKKSTKSKERQFIENNIIFTFKHDKKLPENEKIKKTLETFSVFLKKYYELIQQHDQSFPTLKIKNTQLIKKPNQTNMYYMFVYTMPYNNHPFIIYGNLFKKQYRIIIPFGDKLGQKNINNYENYIEDFKKNELIAILLLLNRTIHIRKENILNNPKFSLLNCDMITNCIKNVNEINKMRISGDNKQKKIAALKKYYKDKALTLLNTYFDLLKLDKVPEAKYLLEGKKNNSKYNYKSRINTFFNNTKETQGHLKIFIPLYKIQSIIKKKMNV